MSSEPAVLPRLTHGRHCRCTPCRAEDWTNPRLAPCGMHGPSCPAVYDPYDRAEYEARRSTPSPDEAGPRTADRDEMGSMWPGPHGICDVENPHLHPAHSVLTADVTAESHEETRTASLPLEPFVAVLHAARTAFGETSEDDLPTFLSALSERGYTIVASDRVAEQGPTLDELWAVVAASLAVAEEHKTAIYRSGDGVPGPAALAGIQKHIEAGLAARVMYDRLASLSRSEATEKGAG